MMNEIQDEEEYIIMDNSDDFSVEDSSIDDSNSDSDVSITSDIWDDIFEDEPWFESSELTQGKYLIGLPGYLRNTNEWLYLSSISPRCFYKYEFKDVTNYLQTYSLSYVHEPKVHIMKLIIQEDGTCNVVLKTFWLKIVQRKWKSVYKKKQEYIRKMTRRSNLFARELGKRFYCPTLSGMMA